MAATAMTPAAGAIHLDADVGRPRPDGLRLDPRVETIGRDVREPVFDLPIARLRPLGVLSVGGRRPIVSVPSVTHHPDAYDHAAGADEHGNEAKDRSHRCPPRCDR
jgi:hypothetical protein